MSSNKIMLTSSDGESFEVEEVVAKKMQIVRHMIEDDCVINEIPLQNVTGKILTLVIEYCKNHVDDDVADQEQSEEAKKEKKDDSTTEEDNEEAKKKELETWDAKFMKDLDMTTILRIVLAANYLNVKGLLDLTSQTVADHIKDMSVEKVRETFNVENDYTPEEEAKVREENAWAFQ